MKNNRRDFIKKVSVLGAGLSLTPSYTYAKAASLKKIMGSGNIGIVGLDTSHSPAFAKVINSQNSGYKVTTAFTTVSPDIPASAERVDKFTQEISNLGIEVTSSLDMLIDKVDYIILNTVDGRLHLEQAKKILKSGKRVFINKPMAASLKDVIEIFNLSGKLGVPIFTSSSIRFMKKVQKVREGSIGRVLGADTYTPISYEPTHPDLFWYGIHGVEMLFTLMKVGCKRVKRLTTTQYDIVTGDWGDGRIGNYRGLKNKMQKYGGQAFGEKGVSYLGDFENFNPMVDEILHYFSTGEVPVQPNETIEIFAFMEAAHESTKNNGNWVLINDILEKSGYKL